MQTRFQGTMIALTLLVMLLLAREADAGARGSPIVGLLFSGHPPLETGQTTCWDPNGDIFGVDCAGTGQDGELRRGERRKYVDNGDGTIRDQRTGLTWEKLSDDGSIHDKDNFYTWGNASAKIDDLNIAAFAGFTDWRVPNLFELQSIVNLGVLNPAVSPAFNANCGLNSGGNPGCTVTTCSCTALDFYWSSSTVAVVPQEASGVQFDSGSGYPYLKTYAFYVRAVRGGS